MVHVQRKVDLNINSFSFLSLINIIFIALEHAYQKAKNLANIFPSSTVFPLYSTGPKREVLNDIFWANFYKKSWESKLNPALATHPPEHNITHPPVMGSLMHELMTTYKLTCPSSYGNSHLLEIVGPSYISLSDPVAPIPFFRVIDCNYFQVYIIL